MTDFGTEFTTPVGRIVWGHPTKARQKTDPQTKQPKVDAQGQPIMEYTFGLAIPEADFQQYVAPYMMTEAAKGYPNGAPQKFSWKTTYPHEIDSNGKPYSEREGYAGHVVIAVASSLGAPGLVKFENGVYRQLNANEIKCGDYVQCALNLKVNVPTDRTHTPSLYVNPLSVNLVGYGQEIQGGGMPSVDPTKAFGNQPVALPPGASATPTAPETGVQMPGAPGMPAQPGNPSPPVNMPGALSPSQGAPASPQPAPPPPAPAAPPTGPQRPTDPNHIHNNGNGTEQWFINGAWDGGAHPVQVAAPQMPPPASDFIPAPGAPGNAPGMPGQMPPR